MSVGGLICNIGAAFVPVYGDNNLGYKLTYLLPCLIGVGITITALFISSDIDGDARVIDMNFSKRVRFNFNLVKNGLKLKQLWQTLVFYLILAIVTPNFREFYDYYYNFQSIRDGSVELAMFSGILASTIFFHCFLQDIEIRTLQKVAVFFNIINCCLNLCLVFEMTFGLSKF